MLISNKTLLASAIIFSSLYSATPSTAGDVYCITKQQETRMLSGKWNRFKFNDHGRTRSGKSKYLKNGKNIVITDDGTVHKKGTWKKRGNTIYRYAPSRPSGKRFKFNIKKSCKNKKLIY